MSATDRAFVEPSIGLPALTVAEAIASVLVASISVDGLVSVEESVRLNGVLATSNVVRQAGDGGVHALADRAIALLTEHGLPAVLTSCAKVIPADLRPTTFALAADLELADGRLGDREKMFLDELQSVLLLDDATADKIVEVLLIKNRG